MGALIGMLLASRPGAPIRKLGLNDAGAFVAKEGLARVYAHLGNDPTFESLEVMEAAVRANNASFGALTDEQWRKMTRDSALKKPEGGYGFAYDPHIADPFKAGPVDDVDLWPVWDSVRCPTLLLRGETSDMIARDVAEAMTRRGPRAKLVEFKGVGHAPPLLGDDEIGSVRDFLLG